jgi:hypothetical protein
MAERLQEQVLNLAGRLGADITPPKPATATPDKSR